MHKALFILYMPLLVPTWNRYIAVVGACVDRVELEIQFIRTSLSGNLVVYCDCSRGSRRYGTAGKIIFTIGTTHLSVATNWIKEKIAYVYLRTCTRGVTLLYVCRNHL